MEELLIEIFCEVDDFCKLYDSYCKSHLIKDNTTGNKVFPKTLMSASEIMTIAIFFHLSNQRTFKWYYKNHICKDLKEFFPKRLSYNRFVEVMQLTAVPLLM